MTGRDKKIKRSMFWILFDKFGTQLVNLVVTFVLARILLPEDYGVVAIVSVFVEVANTIVSGGFSVALIQKDVVDEEDYSSVFIVNIIIAIGLYLLLALCATPISRWYGQKTLETFLPVLSLALFFTPFNTIHSAIIAREMCFEKSFVSNLACIIISGVVGIGLAITGFGVWSLIISQLASKAVALTVMLWVIKWRPQWCSLRRAKKLLEYGWKLLVASLLGILCENLSQLVVGKRYSSDQLGFYNRGNSIPNMLIDKINSSISVATFPAMAEQQDKREALRDFFSKTLSVSYFVLFPLLFGLIGIAPQFIEVTLTSKWLPCVPFLQVACIRQIMMPLQTTNGNVVKAAGQSGLFLKIESVSRIVTILALLIAIPYGPLSIMWGTVFAAGASTLLYIIAGNKVLACGFGAQFRNIQKPFLAATIMLLVVFFIQKVEMSVFFVLFLQIFGGGIIYFLMAWILQCPEMMYLFTKIKLVVNKKI